MGTAQGGYGGGGGYGGQQSPYGVGSGGFATASNGGAGYYPPGSQYGGSPQSTYGMPQQPAYGMGTGGQYSPQLRQAQTAWQNQYTGGQQDLSAIDPAYQNYLQTNSNYASTKLGYTDWIKDQQQKNPTPVASMDNWMPPQQQAPQNYYGQRQPYGMGAQGMGNAYGYGGQQGNPWAAMLAQMQQPQQQGSTSLAPPAAPPADWNGLAGYDFRHNPATNPNIRPQALAAAQAPMQAPPPMPTSFSGINNLPRGAYQIPGYNSPPSATAAEPQDRYAALARAMNPSGATNAGAYLSPQPAPAAPTPAAPGTDVMRKALATTPNQGTTNGYGYGTPGGYQLDTAPSTLDPGSMTGLLAMMGGNVNGRNWQGQAADYENWYRNTYGKQAPGGATAYWTT
jgi:hypothetical protein